MASSSPPVRQRRLTTWSKLLLTLSSMSFIVISTFLGVMIGPWITPLGILLNVRAILQIIFARLNNHRMVKAVGGAVVEGLIASLPDLGDEDKAYFRKLVGKKLTIDEFLEKIKASKFVQDTPEFWEAIAVSTINLLAAKGFKVDRPIDVNVPVYKVSLSELRDTLVSLKNQLFPVRKVWIVLNDPTNQAVRDGINEWIREQQAEAHEFYEQGLIAEEQFDAFLNRWQLIDLTVSDKRSAMAAAWLASMGIEETELETVIGELFENPNKELALTVKGNSISLNVDSDTVAHSWASFVTYLSFVLFDLGGLTSNVRIKNATRWPDFSQGKGFFATLTSWILSVWTFFRYDYANNVERAAQSWFWCVVCMSGPWMALLTSTIPHWLGRFVNYTYRGVRIISGDDRKATYEQNRRKLRVAYHPWVLTYTDAPDNWKRWRVQQDRWTMSMFANFFTSLIEGQIWLLHPWAILDQMYAAGFTFLILGVFIRLAIHATFVAITVNTADALQVVEPYLIVFLLTNLFHGIYSAWDNKDIRGLFAASTYWIVVVVELVKIKFNRLFIKGVAEKGYRWAGR